MMHNVKALFSSFDYVMRLITCNTVSRKLDPFCAARLEKHLLWSAYPKLIPPVLGTNGLSIGSLGAFGLLARGFGFGS